MAAEEKGYRAWTVSTMEGLGLHVRDYGDPLSSGVPVFCLSGLTRNSHDFETIAAHLAPKRRVVTMDYRGRGRSDYDSDWRNYRPETYVQDAVQVLAALDLRRPVIFGTSLGGLLAMALATMQPTLMRGAILNDIGPELESAGAERIIDVISEDHPQPDWDHAVQFLRDSYPRYTRASEADWRRLAEGTFREGEDGKLHYNWDLAIAKRLKQDQDRHDLWKLFRALRFCPVLVLRGETSDILSAETVEHMAESHPDIEGVVVEGAAHAPMLNEEESITAIDAYFERMDGGRA